jgi:hypothetical protein
MVGFGISEDLAKVALQVVFQHLMLPSNSMTASIITTLENRLPTLRKSIISSKQKRIDATESGFACENNWEADLENQFLNRIGFIDQTELAQLDDDLKNTTKTALLLKVR